MKIYCDICGKRHDKTFNSIIRLDYEIPGKGKLYEWNLCINCRNKFIKRMKSYETKK